MINLNIQINLVIFSLIYGFLFSIVLDFLNIFINKLKRIYSLLFYFLFVLIMSIVYFIGINKIGNVIFHIYSIFCIIVGFFCYELIIKAIANTKKK